GRHTRAKRDWSSDVCSSDLWLVASETCALETVGARFIRDVAPGEVLRIDDRGPVTVAEFPASRRGLCVFEHVYLASAASDLEGRSEERRVGKDWRSGSSGAV